MSEKKKVDSSKLMGLADVLFPLIEVQDEAEISSNLADWLKLGVVMTLAMENAPIPASVNLLFTSDARLQEMNREFREMDKVTDVLSFPDGEEPHPGAPPHLGDIAISVPQAERQAEAGVHHLSAELLLLTVHGTLHLLGYDHATPEEKTAMWSAQSAILTALNAPITEPKPSDE